MATTPAINPYFFHRPLNPAAHAEGTYPETDFYGNDLANSTPDLVNITLMACAAKCRATAGCAAYLYGSIKGCTRCCGLKTRIDYGSKVDYPGLSFHIGGPGRQECSNHGMQPAQMVRYLPSAAEAPLAAAV